MPSEDDIRDALGTVMDPEIALDIVSLGLIEKIEIEPQAITVSLIMTSPTCPMGDLLQRRTEAALYPLAKDAAVVVKLLDQPVWSPERMTLETRLRMGWSG
jgi:metal-sulfur cluster biosynthetic enzyme